MPDKKIFLTEKDIPRKWYNLVADLSSPPSPMLHPVTQKPVRPKDLSAFFPESLIEQELSRKRWIGIPSKLIDVYKMWRPTPLVRAYNLEKALKTKARIYYKDESVSPSGSHKANTAVAQVFFNEFEGIKRLTAAEPGGGQWGSTLSFACSLFGLQCQTYMPKIIYQQNPYRKILINTWGAEIDPSPSTKTKFGWEINRMMPDLPGSLGIAISEAIEDAGERKDTKYSLGSIWNFVLLHQTIIGLEVKKQLELAGEKKPDIMIGCVGGGSNFAGLIFPFVKDKIKGGKGIKFIAAEPLACPSLTKGVYRYDFEDSAKKSPLLLMHTLGQTFTIPEIYATGLRFHGCAPLLSMLAKEKIVEARAFHQTASFEAGLSFVRSEGIMPAPETTYAIKAVIDEAKRATEEKVIVFNLSGHGRFDLASYDMYFSGEMKDYVHLEESIKKALENTPKVRYSRHKRA